MKKVGIVSCYFIHKALYARSAMQDRNLQFLKKDVCEGY